MVAPNPELVEEPMGYRHDEAISLSRRKLHFFGF
jgi:hypothetical protein